MASGAGAPGDRPPGDEPLGGKALSDHDLISALREISEEELMKHGIKVVRVGVPNPCDNNKKMAKKTPWYVGDEGYETIRVDGLPHQFDKSRRHFIILSPPSSPLPSEGASPGRSVTPSGPNNQAVVVAWPLGMTPPPGTSCERAAAATDGGTTSPVVPENAPSPDYPDWCYGLSPASSDDVDMQSESSGPDPALPSDDYSESESEFEIDDESDEDYQEPPSAG